MRTMSEHDNITNTSSNRNKTPNWTEWTDIMYRLFMAATGTLVWLWYGLGLLFLPADFPWLHTAQAAGIIKHPQSVGVWFIFVGILQIEAASRKSPRLRKVATTFAVFTCVSWIFTREIVAIVEGTGYLDAPLLWVYVLCCNVVAIMATQPGTRPPTPAEVLFSLLHWLRDSTRVLLQASRQSVSWVVRRRK